MERAPAPPMPADDGRDQVVVLRGISWAHYQSLLVARGDCRRPRLAYLDGALEVMTTGRPHEYDKTLLARLLEAYADATDMELNGIGNTTFQDQAEEAGLEPDECYFAGAADPEVPELAIEIVKTSGGIDKLEIYRRLGVPEVWFWIERRFWVYRRAGGGYRRRSDSVFFRGIDLDELAHLVTRTNYTRQTQVVKAYRKRIERRRQS